MLNLWSQIVWRVVGLNGTVQVERGTKDGQPGNVVMLYYLIITELLGIDFLDISWYNVILQVTLFDANKVTKSTFYPYTGVIEELKTFFEDVFQTVIKVVYHKDIILLSL